MSHQITLISLEKATEQQVFNQAAKHLLTQNKKSKNRSKCLYKSKSGLKCAAGCFISDKQYKKEFDSCSLTSWDDIINEFNLTKKHKDLISELQHIHDAFHPNQWKTMLIELAQEYNLNTIVINNFKKIK